MSRIGQPRKEFDVAVYNRQKRERQHATMLLGAQEIYRERVRDAVKFLMGLGTNPSLTAQDQQRLREFMRGPFAEGLSEEHAHRVLREIGWER
jgi:hypothetical protein